METKTCPHCNEVAERQKSWDQSHRDGESQRSHALECWSCTSCSRMFYTYPDWEELNE